MTSKEVDVAEELETVRRALELTEKILMPLDRQRLGYTTDAALGPPPNPDVLDMLMQLVDAVMRLASVVEKHEAAEKERASAFDAFMSNARIAFAKIPRRR